MKFIHWRDWLILSTATGVVMKGYAHLRKLLHVFLFFPPLRHFYFWFSLESYWLYEPYFITSSLEQNVLFTFDLHLHLPYMFFSKLISSWDISWELKALLKDPAVSAGMCTHTLHSSTTEPPLNLDYTVVLMRYYQGYVPRGCSCKAYLAYNSAYC